MFSLSLSLSLLSRVFYSSGLLKLSSHSQIYIYTDTYTTETSIRLRVCVCEHIISTFRYYVHKLHIDRGVGVENGFKLA